MFLSLALAVSSACGGGNTPSAEQAPGAKKTSTTKALETGAKIVQSNPPIDAVSIYLDGFHVYSDDPDETVEAHHYTTILNEDVMQAVIFDGNTKDAKLMGVEYIISERLFNTLPPEEKKLWHSHRYEVKSGLLVAPRLSARADDQLMKKIVSTYGKTWHTWHTDRDKQLPTGIPELMMAAVADGQIPAAKIADRDRRLGVNTADIATRRAVLPTPELDPLADPYTYGEFITLMRGLAAEPEDDPDMP